MARAAPIRSAADAHLLAGRDVDARQLLRAIDEHKTVRLTGESGTGKSAQETSVLAGRAFGAPSADLRAWPGAGRLALAWLIHADLVDLLRPSTGECDVAQIAQPALQAALEEWAVGDMYSAFVSYDHADRALASQLSARLRAEGVALWLDDHLYSGDDLGQQARSAVGKADRLILLCTEASLSSWWVDRELQLAREKQAIGQIVAGLRPVDVRGSDLPPPTL